MKFEPFKISGGDGEPFVISRLRFFLVSGTEEVGCPEEEAVCLSGFCFATSAARAVGSAATMAAAYLFDKDGRPELLNRGLAWRTDLS